MSRNRMNLVAVAVAGSLVLLGEQQIHAQGTFRNFDFESAIPPFNPDLFGNVPITNAIPGWTGYINGSPTDGVLYDNLNLSGPSISLVDSLTVYFRAIEGSYSVYLKSFSDHGGTSAAIGQTVQVPNGAVSLFFLREPSSGFIVSFAGQNVPLVQFGTSGNNIIMAGDISSFAGQTGELRFLGTGTFDNIQFSSSTIPEPGGAALVALGLAAAATICRRRSSEVFMSRTAME